MTALLDTTCPAQALASQRRGGSTDHRGNRRPALCRPSRRRRRDEWHDLRAAEQVLIFRSFSEHRDPQDRRHQWQRAGAHRGREAMIQPSPSKISATFNISNHFYDIDLIKTSPRILPVSIQSCIPQASIRPF